MAKESFRKHEVAFCADVAKWAEKIFEENQNLPLGSSDIESFGRGSQKRQDLRFYARKQGGQGKLALCGEVKLPGTAQGRSPFDLALMTDAHSKAVAENCRYFFTWNVEHLALFDRSLWDAESMHERCVGQWKLGEELNKPTDVAREAVIKKIRDEFLPKFFTEFGEIYQGVKPNLGLPPSEFYIAVLETHLSGPMGPVRELRDHLEVTANSDKSFDARLKQWMIEQQWNFNRNDPESWREIVDRAARSMCYVLSNRILFYQAVRARHRLDELKLPNRANTPQKALDYLRECFQEAVLRTGDYEPVFFPESNEESALMALSGVNSLEAWSKFIHAIEKFNFKEIPSDILGGFFQKLISPEERHKFGQHYTDEDIVDVINAFCIRRPEAVVLDPACGSGSFLVRAWYRKHQLDKRMSNQDLLSGLYGCDINPFPAHLATLNLASRLIRDEENYPRIARRNFFTVEPDKPFCQLPRHAIGGKLERYDIPLPELDAVVGNPPYVRHEEIPKAADKGVIRDQTKEHLHGLATRAWPGIGLSKQSDLHVYFWPATTRFLKEGGWFGFLVSSSWLDARYGFALQEWILRHFRLVALIESVDEPWFEDARVKTVAVILQRCEDEAERDANLARFVRLKRPLREILGSRADEPQKQEAAERLRDLIIKTKSDKSTDDWRIMLKAQSELWSEGLSVARMFARQKALAAANHAVEAEDDEEAETDEDELLTETGQADLPTDLTEYGGGKWGRYLRAPDFYFDVMRRFGSRFTRLGDIATIRSGVKSGCDAFFMPRDVSAELLAKYPTETEWKTLPLMHRCSRAAVASGELVIVKCGDNTLHPIEACFVRPEVHSLMQVDRPVVTPAQLNRVVLWVDQELPEIKGTFAHKFITWGSKQTFQSKKSESVPVPERSTCAGRPRWYDLTGLEPGIGFWPEGQQYRHIIPANPHQIVCNHKLFDIHLLPQTQVSAQTLAPLLNSTLVAFAKTFYGRYAGTEGNLQTAVFDTLMLELPDPRHITEPILRRLETAFSAMQKREVTHLVEETFLKCHTAEEVREAANLPPGLPLELRQADRRELDDAVFELLGVTDPKERAELIDRLYREVSLHFRAIRIVEVQKMEQRRQSGRTTVSANQLAQDAWEELEAHWRQPLRDWLAEQNGRTKPLELPEGEPELPDATNFFEATTVYFGRKGKAHLVCASRAEAELLFAVAQTGLRGNVLLPVTEKECQRALQALNSRLEKGEAKLAEFAETRAGTDKLREQVLDVLRRWFIHGKPGL
ncbi:MAG: class I SAM-dependent DNA methyltransferase [Blastocatellales bacterium]